MRVDIPPRKRTVWWRRAWPLLGYSVAMSALVSHPTVLAQQHFAIWLAATGLLAFVYGEQWFVAHYHPKAHRNRVRHDPRPLVAELCKHRNTVDVETLDLPTIGSPSKVVARLCLDCDAALPPLSGMKNWRCPHCGMRWRGPDGLCTHCSTMNNRYWAEVVTEDQLREEKRQADVEAAEARYRLQEERQRADKSIADAVEARDRIIAQLHGVPPGRLVILGSEWSVTPLNSNSTFSGTAAILGGGGGCGGTGGINFIPWMPDGF